MRYEDNEIWLTQKCIAELFGVNVRTVNEHLKNIFDGEELNEISVIRNFRITDTDGKNYNTKHYNLDVVISVGYPKLTYIVLFYKCLRKIIVTKLEFISNL